ncbi:MAG: glycosyltransferase [bacterium]
MRILVVATVQHPLDARVCAREIGALLAAGHEVTYAAPFHDVGVTPPAGVRPIDVPRAQGRRRAAAFRAARRVLRRQAASHDVVLVHGPEVMMAAAGVAHPCIVWDVHEDTGAALGMKPWLPAALRPLAARGIDSAESFASRRHRLIIAEAAYAARFPDAEPVLVPNTPVVPEHVSPSTRGRAVYVGDLTVARGAEEIIEVGRILAPDIGVEVIGAARAPLAERLSAASSAGWIDWRGYLPNEAALARVDGACAGLALLHDEPNYRHSMPTKLYEYLARGVPFVSTPLPLARRLAEDSGGGIIVPYGDAPAAADAVRALHDDDARRRTMAQSGHAWVSEHASWERDGECFVRQLEDWAAAGARGAPDGPAR